MLKKQELQLNQVTFRQMQNNSINQNGIVLYAKSAGQTSFSSLFTIKHALGTKKVGHTGTLDSFAQGLLIVCTSALTRLVSHITAFDKVYESIICFGKETDTLDPTGNIIKETELPSLKNLLLALENFTGKINQTPPAFSAIHIDGKRLSDIARSGKEVEIPSRQVEVYSSEILELVDEDENSLDVKNLSLLNLENTKIKYAKIKFHVSKGTYIRCLARDIGNFCNSSGYLIGLLRTKVGNFKLEDAVGFEFLPEFTINSVLENLKTYQEFSRFDKEIETDLQNQVKEKLCSMTVNLASECGFLIANLKNDFVKDFYNGKFLKYNMFENFPENCQNREIAVFAENTNQISSCEKFLGVVSKQGKIIKYCYVVQNLV